MSIDFKSLDEFPTFTGEESPQEQIRQLQNYLFSMKESIRYLLSNLGVDNMNPTAWMAMKQETINGQTQEDVFNKLFDNGNVQGFDIKGGTLYINGGLAKIINLIANNIVAGVLQSKDGKTFYLDLDKGELKMQATELLVIAEGYVKLPPTRDDCVDILSSAFFPDKYPPKDFYDLNKDGKIDEDDAYYALDMYKGKRSPSECEAIEPSKVTVTLDPSDTNAALKISGKNMWGTELSVSIGCAGSNIPLIIGNCCVSGIFSVGERAVIPSLSLSEDATPKNLSWKDNGDGTFTLIGTEEENT